nr:YciI family protein [Kofleriaceae bacterium]
MKKFLVLYKASRSGFEQMKKATPEQQQQGMQMWMDWSKKAMAAKAIADMGGPLGKSARVSKDGVASDATNDLGGFGVMQAESREALAALMTDHPHFHAEGATIEIIEVMAIPGM